MVCHAFPTAAISFLRSLRALLSTATPTPQLYTLSLHDALPIYGQVDPGHGHILVLRADAPVLEFAPVARHGSELDRKSTRLNSSHRCISYAVFCSKNKISGYYLNPPLPLSETNNYPQLASAL